MTENRFADCQTAPGVLSRMYHTPLRGEPVDSLVADALARIRELTPPTVSEEARERALDALAAYMPQHPDRILGEALGRVIDALGYTPTPAITADCAVCCDPLPAAEIMCGGCRRSVPPASPPVVDLAPDELRWLAAVVEDYEKLYNDASRVVDDDTLPPMFYLHLRDSRQSVRVVCGENCWVLRIGGDQ